MSVSRSTWSNLSRLAKQRTEDDEEEQVRERRRRGRNSTGGRVTEISPAGKSSPSPSVSTVCSTENSDFTEIPRKLTEVETLKGLRSHGVPVKGEKRQGPWKKSVESKDPGGHKEDIQGPGRHVGSKQGPESRREEIQRHERQRDESQGESNPELGIQRDKNQRESKPELGIQRDKSQVESKPELGIQRDKSQGESKPELGIQRDNSQGESKPELGIQRDKSQVKSKPELGIQRDKSQGEPKPELGIQRDKSQGEPKPELGIQRDKSQGESKPELGIQRDKSQGESKPELGIQRDKSQGESKPELGIQRDKSQGESKPELGIQRDKSQGESNPELGIQRDKSQGESNQEPRTQREDIQRHRDARVKSEIQRTERGVFKKTQPCKEVQDTDGAAGVQDGGSAPSITSISSAVVTITASPTDTARRSSSVTSPDPRNSPKYRSQVFVSAIVIPRRHSGSDKDGGQRVASPPSVPGQAEGALPVTNTVQRAEVQIPPALSGDQSRKKDQPPTSPSAEGSHDDGVSPLRRFSPRTSSFRAMSQSEDQEGSPLTRSCSLRISLRNPKLGDRLEKYTSAVQRSGSVRISNPRSRGILGAADGIAGKRSIFESDENSAGTNDTHAKKDLTLPGAVSSRINQWNRNQQDSSASTGTKDIRMGDVATKRSLWQQRSQSSSDTKL
ncbi:ladinin-1 [Ascaphus truei]|uniref:ladinin-1 n=1 Tax=Ascaphus truei TaxID=8439 RepID=UPI003F5A610C